MLSFEFVSGIDWTTPALASALLVGFNVFMLRTPMTTEGMVVQWALGIFTSVLAVGMLHYVQRQGDY